MKYYLPTSELKSGNGRSENTPSNSAQSWCNYPTANNLTHLALGPSLSLSQLQPSSLPSWKAIAEYIFSQESRLTQPWGEKNHRKACYIDLPLLISALVACHRIHTYQNVYVHLKLRKDSAYTPVQSSISLHWLDAVLQHPDGAVKESH